MRICTVLLRYSTSFVSCRIKMSHDDAYVIGVDVGGTNTDAVILRGNSVIAAAKRPTTDDKTSGIVSAICAALDGLPDQSRRTEVLGSVARVSIGTTHFVNAVLERDTRKLARVAVIRLCGSASRAIPPFADFPDDLRRIICGGVHLVSGGLEYSGQEIAPVVEAELRECVREMRQRDPEMRNIVISGVFSPRDDPETGQESLAARIVMDEYPGLSCTLSHGLGLLGLIERENAAILNQSLKSLADRTITAFRQALDELGLTCPFFLTQNDGTLISADEAKQYPVLTFSSGPTNSMRGAVFLSGLRNAIVVDIGGTTSDVGVVKNGFPREANTQMKVGEVRTNFCMPDVHSIALGGGSRVEWDPNTSSVRVGPSSVANRLETEALCFGGSQCTGTDVAIASGIAPVSICGGEEGRMKVKALETVVVYAAMREVHRMLEAAIDCVKVDKEDVPVLLVGGGSILVDQRVPLKGVSRLIIPKEFGGVANAIGAALGTVGGTSDHIHNLQEIKEQVGREEGVEGDALEERARAVAVERGWTQAREEARKKGAVPKTIYIHSEDVSDVAYVPDRLKVKVKAIGSLGVFGGGDRGESKEKKEPVTDQQLPTLDKVVSGQLSRDNPDWPYCSPEDRAWDEAAGLPPPTIKDGAWLLKPHDVECLAVGAGILGCGGGGDPNIGRVMALRLLEEGKEICVVNPCKLAPSQVGLVTCVAFMGAPVILNEKLVSGEETTLALQSLQRLLASGVCEKGEGKEGNEKVSVSQRSLPSGGQMWVANQDDLQKIDISRPEAIPRESRITTLVCAEIGGCNSIEPLLVGARLGLPVIDADGMGRAFPELQMYLPLIYGCRPWPSSLADNKGDVVSCSHVTTPKSLEDFFRVECIRMGMSAGITLGTMTLPEVLRCCVLHSMSKAWQLGRAIERARGAHTSVTKAVVEQQHGTLIIVGKLVGVTRIVEGGFVRMTVVVEGLEEFAGHQVTLDAKNEFYIARYLDTTARSSVGPVLACTPDLICVIDSDTGYPITTEMIRYGLRVSVIALLADERLKTPQAMPVVGPGAFGFPDVHYAPPRSIWDCGISKL